MASVGSTPSITPKERVQAVQLSKQPATEMTSEISSEKQAVNKKPADIILFTNESQYASEAPKTAAVGKPAGESIRAAASSSNPAPALFTIDSKGRFVVAEGYPVGVKSDLPAFALAATSNSQGSSDKKEGGNIYNSANKSLKDLRKEKSEFLREYDTRSIMEYA